MEAEIKLLEHAVHEARKVLAPVRTGPGTIADAILQKAQQDVALIKDMRQVAQEEIKKTFGDV